MAMLSPTYFQRIPKRIMVCKSFCDCFKTTGIFGNPIMLMGELARSLHIYRSEVFKWNPWKIKFGLLIAKLPQNHHTATSQIYWQGEFDSILMAAQPCAYMWLIGYLRQMEYNLHPLHHCENSPLRNLVYRHLYMRNKRVENNEQTWAVRFSWSLTLKYNFSSNTFMRFASIWYAGRSFKPFPVNFVLHMVSARPRGFEVNGYESWIQKEVVV